MIDATSTALATPVRGSSDYEKDEPLYLSREELYELVWSEPAQQLASRFGVSDVWLSKICRNVNVPRPPRGYWAKLRSGQKPPQASLPPLESGGQAHVVIRNDGSKQQGSETESAVKVLASTSPAIPVPKLLKDPHPFVAATKARADSVKPDADGRVHVYPHFGVFKLTVSRSVMGRSLRLLQAICDEAIRRGWKIGNGEPERSSRDTQGGFLLIGRHKYQIIVEEKTEPVPFTEEDIRQWKKNRPSWVMDYPPPHARRRNPTGVLTLVSPAIWRSRSNWSDGKRGLLEGKLPEFFATLEVRAVDDEERHLERERELKASAERQRRALIESARVRRLDGEVAAHQRAETIRSYVLKVRARLNETETAEAKELVAWCGWAEKYADRIDPAINLRLITGLYEEWKKEDW